MTRKLKKKEIKKIISIIFFIICAVVAFLNNLNEAELIDNTKVVTYSNVKDFPAYTDEIYVAINNNIPYFTEKDYTTKSFEMYSKLDNLGRCGVAYANICKAIMPKEEREDISQVYPTGWKQKQYGGEYLYNRCHLIGHQLAGENANELNLITGTRYFNVSGMLPFENEIADYIYNNENNHVLYRVTPIFEGNNLLASGVKMEAYSVEDNGKGICFNVFVYNIQPGINIDYSTGKSWKN